MKCGDLMKSELQWLPGTSSVQEAARLMRDRSVGFLLISNESTDGPVAVVTDRDLAIRVCAEGLDAARTPILQVATTEDVVACSEEEDLETAEEKMAAAQKSRLLITNSGGQVIGVLSLTDILRGDGARRAVRTANAVLSREANAPHAPIESIQLTASTPEDEEAAVQRQHVVVGEHRGSMKVFPG